MLPFTAEQFFDVFVRYNDMMWPAPVAAYALGAIAIIAALRGHRAGNHIAAAILALFWIWTGVFYFWSVFAAINPAAWLFGVLFAVQAALLLGFTIGGQLRFAWRPDLNGIVGLVFVAYAAIIYPLIGIATGHSYPAAPTFGITPCPVTIFTLGLLLLVRPLPWTVLVIPVLWSLIGGTAAFLLQVPQDWLLLLSGPLALALRWRGRAMPV